MSTPVRHCVLGTVLEIYSGDQIKPGSVYDFEKIGFSKRVAKAFVRAFVALSGANSLESQRANWIQIRRFGNYSFESFGRPTRLPPECLVGFQAWMLERGLGVQTIGSAHTFAVRVLHWCLRNAPQSIHPKTATFRLPRTVRKQEPQGPVQAVLDEPLLRKVLAACYTEIDEAEERILDFRKIPLSPDPSELADLLMYLLRCGDGILASQGQVTSRSGAKFVLTRLRPYGGLRGLYQKFYLTPEDIFPYYLAILIQTSGNPQSLLHANHECIVSVPMRLDLEKVVWDKARAGREQAPDFPKDKEWAAPNIIRRLLRINEELRPFARAKYAESLFLCRNSHGHVAPPSWQTIHNCFREFRARHSIPKFDLRSLRAAGGQLHHQAARSLAAAKQRLQHVNESTTQRYTRLSGIRSVHEKTILRFQGLLISESRRFSQKPTTHSLPDPLWRGAETVFGFGCKDPLGGVAPGSRKGEACPSFHQCATCPGALIVVDDPASVARLLRSMEHLEQERDRAVREGWSQRFEMLYEGTLAILQRDILPGVSSQTLAQARAIPTLSLPRLE